MAERTIVNVQLRRNGPQVPWGFTVRESSKEYPYVIHKVAKMSLASAYLSRGDALLMIEGRDVASLTFHEIDDLIFEPATTLSMQLLKKTDDFASCSRGQQVQNVQMRRSCASYPWGFTVIRVPGEHPYIVHQVAEGSLASLNLTPGDVILKIEDNYSSNLTFEEVDDLIADKSLSLSMQLLKGYGTLIYDSKFSNSMSRQVTRMRAEQETTQEEAEALQEPHREPEPQEPSTSRIITQRSPSESSNSDETQAHRSNLRNEKEKFWDMICGDQSSWRNNENAIGEASGSSGNRNSRLEHWIESGKLATNTIERRYNRLPQNEYQHSTNESNTPEIPIYSGYNGRIDNPSSSMRYLTDPCNERQGDLTFWELDQSEPALSRCASPDKIQKKNSFVSNASDASTLPRLSEPKIQPRFGRRVESTTSSSMPKELGRCMPNFTVKSGYQKTVSIVNKTYSTVNGVKSLKTFEQLNKTTKNDKTLKTVEGGKTEVTEKTEKNKEYVLENKDEIGGTLKETKKVLNEYSKTENKLDGDAENCLRINERLEENLEDNLPSDETMNRDSNEQKGVYKSELKIELNYNSKNPLKRDSDNKILPNTTDKGNPTGGSTSEGQCSDNTETVAKRLRQQQKEISDETLPSYSEFKNKLNFFSEMSRKLSSDNHSSEFPRSSSPDLSEGRKPTSSEYWSEEDKSVNEVTLEETNKNDTFGASTSFGSSMSEPRKTAMRPQTNFKTSEEYLSFIGRFRK